MEIVAFAIGLLLLSVAYWDPFETAVVPHPTPGIAERAAVLNASRSRSR